MLLRAVGGQAEDVVRAPLGLNSRNNQDLADRLKDFVERNYSNTTCKADFTGSLGLDPSGIDILLDSNLLLAPEMRELFNQGLEDSEVVADQLQDTFYMAYEAGDYQAALDVLRGLAIALVLARHTRPDLFPGAGLVGVVVFFALSGHLITGLLVEELDRTGRLDLRRFYARRFRRLVPALVLLVAVFKQKPLNTFIF